MSIVFNQYGQQTTAPGVGNQELGQHAASTGDVPLSLASLKLWLRADRGVTLNGSTVASWANQCVASGAWGHATQGTAANQPTYRASAINNRPAIEGDGSNDALNGTASLTGTKFQLFVISKTLATPANGGIFSLTKAAINDFDNNNLIAFYQVSGPSTFMYRNGSQVNLSGPTVSASVVASVKWDGVTGSFKNGATVSANLINSTSFSATGYILMGRWSGVNANPTNIQIAEVVACDDTLSSAEESRLYTYFRNRYGVTTP